LKQEVAAFKQEVVLLRKENVNLKEKFNLNSNNSSLSDFKKKK